MTICFIIKRFHPIIGGSETQTLLLGRWLASHGNRCVIATLHWDPRSPKEETIDGIRIYRFPKRQWLTGLGRLLWRNRKTYSVVQSQGATSAYNTAASIICSLLRIPHVGRIEGETELPNLRKRKFGTLRLLALGRSSALVAISNPIVDQLRQMKLRNNRILLIPNAVDPHFSLPASREELSDRNPIVLFVGRLVVSKGVDILINAWKTVVTQRPEARLVIVGTGGNDPESVEENLKRQAESLKLSHSVRFAGASYDVKRFYNAAHIFVLPSRREGQGIVALEAMASGLPIIAANVGGIPDMIQDGLNGLLVPPEDPESLAHAILRLMNDQHLAQKFASAGRGCSESGFSLDAVGERYLELYAKLQR